MYTVSVQLPGGRRQQVKVTPNTTLLQVLEEVCTKYGFNATEYDLRHHNKILDISSIFRFASLPNNAQLEMIEAVKKRQESLVTLGLQLESGERLTGTFTPGDTVWHVVTALKPDEEKMINLVVIYMRREICGKENMSKITLRSLGLTGGRAMFRLFHKSPEELHYQANITTNLTPPQLNEKEKKISKSKLPEMPFQTLVKNESSSLFKNDESPNDDASAVKGTGSLSEALKKKANDSSAKYTKLDTFNFKGNIMEKLIKDEKARLNAAKEEMKSQKANQIESAVSARQKSLACEKLKSVEVPEESQNKNKYFCDAQMRAVENTDDKYVDERREKHGKVILLGERNAVAYDLNSIKSLEFEEEPDDFYDLTIGDAKMLLKEAKRLCVDLEEAPLMTAAQRQLEKDKKVLALLHRYKNTVIRIKFPDRTVLQGTFSSAETISAVEKFVAEYLENPSLKFYLYTTPPKVVLKPEERLIECGCVPSSIVYLGMSGNIPMPFHYLKSDVLNKLSSPSAADLTALQSWGSDKGVARENFKVDKMREIKKKNQDEPGPSNNQLKIPKWFRSNK